MANTNSMAGMMGMVIVPPLPPGRMLNIDLVRADSLHAKDSVLDVDTTKSTMDSLKREKREHEGEIHFKPQRTGPEGNNTIRSRRKCQYR